MAQQTCFYCNICGNPARITKKETFSPEYYKMYCSCCNPDCGHRFVINAEYSHSTRSSRLTKDQIFHYLTSFLSKEDKSQLLKALSA